MNPSQISMNQLTTLNVICGESSVYFLNSNHPANKDQSKLVNGGDFTWSISKFTTAWLGTATVEDATSVCDVTQYAVLNTDGSPSTDFVATPVESGGSITITLLPAKQGIVGVFDFKIKVTAEGGKTENFDGSLTIECPVVTITDPVVFVLNPSYAVEAAGGTQEYTRDAFISSET